MELKVLKSIDGCQVHYADNEVFVYSIGMTITARTPGGDVRFETTLGGSDLLSSAVDTVPPAARLLRRGIHSARVSRYDDDRVIVQVDDRLMSLSMDPDRREAELFQTAHGRRVLRRGWCETNHGEILIGEYWPNADRGPVKVFVVREGDAPVAAHTFGPGEIRHIHALEYDPFGRRVWITTGDNDVECMIACLGPEFELEMVIGSGSQEWRTVSLGFYPEAVYWGSDNHLGANAVWRYDRSTQEVRQLGEMVGPVYYNACLPNHVVFSTAMEKGEGTQDGFARLYALELVSGRLEEIRRERKDRLSPKWFGYGLFEFAEGSLGDNRFWVTAKGLEGGLRSELVELMV